MTPLPSGLSTRPESFAPSGESNLRLQRAIESLALNLDDELHRYRQTQSGQAVTPAPARLQLRQTRKPIDLIALKSTAGATTATGAAAAPANPRLREILGQTSQPSSQAYPAKTAVNQVRLSHGGTLTTYRPSPEEYLESTEALLGSLPHRDQPGQDEAPPSLLRQLTTPLGVGALLFLLVGSASFGYLVTSPQAISHLTDNPIARRLKGEPAPEGVANGSAVGDGLDGQAETGFKPLGPDLSEKEFANLDLSNISTLPSANAPAASPRVPVTPVGQTPVAESGTADSTPTAPRPGVLTPAGVSGNSAVVRADIVTAPGRAVAPTQPAAVRPQGAPVAPATRAAAPAAPTAPARQAAPPAALRAAPPAANAQPPQPLAMDRAPAAPSAPAAPPAVAPPAPITQAPPPAAPSYYVVTDYSGAQSLESARSAVGGAYVRNFSGGTRIQLGAFSQESSARSLVNQLQGQGIPAQVISP